MTSGSDRKESDIPSMNISYAGANFIIIKNSESSIRYIWLHGDEKTAQMALSHHIKNYPGIAYFIQSEVREIPYKSTLIDPNRIFSRNGSYHALKKFKPEIAVRCTYRPLIEGFEKPLLNSDGFFGWVAKRLIPIRITRI